MADVDNNAKTIGKKHGKADMHRQPVSKSTSSGMSKSMHDGVEVWCDCCSCEAEPYWVEAMQRAEDTD